MGFDSLGFETSLPPKSAIPSAVVDNEAGLARCFQIKFRRESVFALFHPFSLCYVTATVPISVLLVALEYITWVLGHRKDYVALENAGAVIDNIMDSIMAIMMDDPLFFTLRSLMSHTKKYRPSEAKVYKICEAAKKIMRKAVISILTGTQSPDSLLGGGIEILKGEGLPCLIFSFLLTIEAFAVLRSDAAAHVC
ncbi:hypothetical protein OROMI_008143 [Orobanche minor]